MWKENETEKGCIVEMIIDDGNYFCSKETIAYYDYWVDVNIMVLPMDMMSLMIWNRV